jgi:DNA invertase Pin-like site-specific DNA recombinase
MVSFVAYYRVSTQRQGASGLGLEAQQEAVRGFTKGGTIVAEVVEVESGKRNDRPKLAEALALCRKTKATLIIAKLDRLARNVAFVSNLMESGVDFVAVDFPQANRLTVHILAAIAEHEAAMISQRTRAALQAAKARGKRLGGPTAGTPPQQVLVAAGVRRAADAFALKVHAEILLLNREGVRDPAAIARLLRIPSRHGKGWSPRAIKNVIARVAEIEARDFQQAA